MNEQAIWKLATEGGMGTLTLDRLAEETGSSPLELGRLYPDPSFMVVTLVEAVHRQAMATSPDPSLPLHDRLTDAVMAHLDVCLEHRQAVQRLWSDLTSMPLTLLALRPYLMKIAEQILKDCGLEGEGLWAPVQHRAYFTLFLYVLYVWIYDETPQQEQTLVSLDRGLKQLGAVPW